MKKILATLTLTFALAWSSHAARICYGAWWTTIAPRGVVKEAGQIVIQFDDIGNVAKIGDFKIEARDGYDSFVNWNYLWMAPPKGYVVRFQTLKVLDDDVVWTGTYNTETGQVQGTFRRGGYRGRFQATFQSVWGP